MTLNNILLPLYPLFAFGLGTERKILVKALVNEERHEGGRVSSE